MGVKLKVMAERFINRISALLKEPEAQTQLSPNFRLSLRLSQADSKCFSIVPGTVSLAQETLKL